MIKLKNSEMKFFVFGGGLGNQLFQYSYYSYLKKKNPSEIFFGVYPNSQMAHNGIEIDKWFDISLPSTSFLSDKLGIFLYRVNRFLYYRKCPLLFCNRTYPQSTEHFFQWGNWQNYSIVKQVEPFKFRPDLFLGEENKQILEKMKMCNSVSVHVRRGDYLNPNLKHLYGGICTQEYYQKAMAIVLEKVEHPVFFFFSDDALYIEKEFADIKNKVIVSHNKKDRSVFDGSYPTYDIGK